MAGTLDASTKVVPADLQIVAVPDTNKDYFNFTVTNLKINTNYAFQFQYVYSDGSVGEWSPGYIVYTNSESIPSAPSASVPSTNASYIPVTLPAFPANAKRVDVYVVGGVYGTGKVADSFLQAGTKSISVAAGTYQVSLITVSPSGINGAPSNTFTITITDPTANIQSPEASKTPSAPTVSSVLGAIQVSWDGKQADGSNQPYGFNAAKVYVGTTAGFTPGPTNQVDVLNFANGQNTLDISVGTVVAGTAMTYGTDYYIKIATTNGTDTSTPVAANGNPVRIGQVGSGDIVEITADKIKTGVISTQTITVGAPSGKRVELRGSGNPIEIFGTGGQSLLSYNGDTLSIVGSGTFTGSLTGASGVFGPVTIGPTGISSTNFSIANDGSASFNGILTANGGSIGGWYINSSILRSSSSATATPRIELDPLTPQIVLAGTAGSIAISPQNGIVGPTVTVAGNTGSSFLFGPDGTAVLRGSIYADNGIFSGEVRGGTFSLSGNTSTNKWDTSGFIAGSSSTYIQALAGGTITLYSNPYQLEIDESGSSQSTTSFNYPTKIVVDGTSVNVYGLPGVGNGLTYLQSLEYGSSGAVNSNITRYWSDPTSEYSPYPPYNYIGTRGNNSNRTLNPNAGPTYNYGAAARYRMIVADPYDNNKLKRGLGVYYGSTSTAPGASTGFVGDLWVSW